MFSIRSQLHSGGCCTLCDASFSSEGRRRLRPAPAALPPSHTEIRPGWASALVELNVRAGKQKRSELLGGSVQGTPLGRSDASPGVQLRGHGREVRKAWRYLTSKKGPALTAAHMIQGQDVQSHTQAPSNRKIEHQFPLKGIFGNCFYAWRHASPTLSASLYLSLCRGLCIYNKKCFGVTA